MDDDIQTESIAQTTKLVEIHKLKLDSSALYRDNLTSPNLLEIRPISSSTLEYRADDDCTGDVDGFEAYMSEEARKRRERQLLENADIEYDTDLDENDERSETPFDAHGRRTYLRACQKLKLVPVSRIARDLMTSSLVIRDRGLGERHSQALSRALIENTSITELYVEDNALNTMAFSYLCSSLYDNLYVSSLSFRNTGIDYNSAKNICDLLLHNHLITNLNLSENRLDDSVAVLLGHVLEASRTLKTVNLSHNQFTETDCNALAFGIGENDSMTDLDLSWNHIRSSGALRLCKEIQRNAVLQRLNLEMNGLGDAGAAAVADLLKGNTSLQELNISGARITDKGAFHVGKALETNQTLHVLKLTNNPMTNVGVYAVISSIQKSTSRNLHLVEIGSVNINQDVLDLYQTIRRQRSELVVVLGQLMKTTSSTFTNSLPTCPTTY